MKTHNTSAAGRTEPAWFNWLMQKPTVLLGLIVAVLMTPVVLSFLVWGKYGAMITLSLIFALGTGVFFGQLSERKRTGVLAGMASGVATAGVFALALLVLRL